MKTVIRLCLELRGNGGSLGWNLVGTGTAWDRERRTMRTTDVACMREYLLSLFHYTKRDKTKDKRVFLLEIVWVQFKNNVLKNLWCVFKKKFNM